MMSRMRLVLCVLLLRAALISGTSDLNYLKLQMVADHLTEKECHKLYEALHMKHFFLDHELSGTELPEVECIDLLMRWNNETGHNTTFHQLSLRLKEISRPELAARLSTSVFHELASAVLEDFGELSDPGGELAPEDLSAAREEAALQQKHAVLPPEEQEDGIASHFVWFFAAVGAVSAAVLGLFIVNKTMFPVVETFEFFCCPGRRNPGRGEEGREGVGASYTRLRNSCHTHILSKTSMNTRKNHPIVDV